MRVVHSVGSDTVIGKKVVTLELDRAARERGERSVYVPTGQTGVAIAGWGIAVDHVISDYVAGAAERLVHEGAEHGDLLFVEGQGALFHPAYSGVTLGLLHGSAPDVLVLVHKAGATGAAQLPRPADPAAGRAGLRLRGGGATGAAGARGGDRAEHGRPRLRRGGHARRSPPRRPRPAWWPTTWSASAPDRSVLEDPAECASGRRSDPSSCPLVTGATGFVGGRLALELQRAGHRVRCLVRDRERARDLERGRLRAARGRRARPRQPRRRRRGRRRRLLPRPLHGPRRRARRLRRARAARRGQLRRDGARRGHRPGRLPGRPRRQPELRAPGKPRARPPRSYAARGRR